MPGEVPSLRDTVPLLPLLAILFIIGIASIGLSQLSPSQAPAAFLAQAAGSSNDEVANMQCAAPNANQVYQTGSSCGETIQEGQTKKVNLYGCQCQGPGVKGICTQEHFCQGQQCFINGNWGSCEKPGSSGAGVNTGQGENTGANVCASGGCVTA